MSVNRRHSSMEKVPKKTLRDGEWVFVFSILFLMCSVVVVSKINAARSSSYLEEHPLRVHEPCSVVIEGAVTKPGTFSVPPGTLLRKVIKKSCPTPYADLKEFSSEQRVEESMSIHIKELTEITLTIERVGFEPEQVVVPAGTKGCQLKKLLTFEVPPSKIFKSRRFLKDGEVICLGEEEKRQEDN